MTIRVYPSRLEGEPIETHETEEKLSIVDWLKSVAPDFELEAENKHPTIRLNGCIVLVEDWPLTYFKPSDVLDVYIEPRGGSIGNTIAAMFPFWSWPFVAANALFNLFKPRIPKAQRQGQGLEGVGDFANSIRWGDPIPENYGEPRIYPPYLAPPRSYYEAPRVQNFESLLCVGNGKYQKSITNTFINDTPRTSLGDDFFVQFFEPNETIPAEMRQWWYTPEEVGFTTLGGSGLTLTSATEVPAAWAQSFTFSGGTITGDEDVPNKWNVGMFVVVEAEHPVTFSGGSIQSALLDTLGLSAGDSITLGGTNAGDYVIASITPAIPASSGSEAKATGTAAPTTFDFSTTSAYLDVMFDSFGHIVTLDANYTDLSGLVAHIGTSLSGSGLSARSVGSFVEIYEDPPYTGNTIEISGDVATVFGTVTYTAGTPPTSAEPAKYNISGADFGNATEVTSAGPLGLRYEIIAISGDEIQVLPEDVTVWTGFPINVSAATSYVTLDESDLEGGWTNWFTAVPDGETSSYFECDIFYPKGLWQTGSKQRPWWLVSEGYIQWRYVDTPTDINTVTYSHRNVTQDQVGYTIAVTLPAAGRFQVRSRRKSAPREWKGEYDQQQWSGLRARLDGAPESYPFTTMFVRMRSGDKISGNSENKVNLFAKRILPRVDNPAIEEPTRDIVPAVLHMTDSVGYDRSLLDMPKLESLHETWVARGDTFDLSVSSSTTLKTVINYALGAGMAELTLKSGKISAVREQYQLGTPNRIYSPQEMTGFLSESTEAVMPDDIDGVDIDYVERETGREVTVQYRLQGDLGHRVEKITAPGVSGRTQAWRIAARRRRDAAFSRTMFNGGTELAAMNSYYGDFVGLQDGITGWGQSAFVLSVSGTTMILSEEVKPTDGTMVAMLRKPDGSATVPVPVSAYDGRSLTLSMIPDDITISSDPNSPTIVYIGSNTRIIHQAIMKSVEPSANGTVSFVAKKYDARVFLEDDMGPDHVILTSMPYPVYDVDNAQATLAITSIVRREIEKVVDLSDDADATLAIASIVRRDIYRVREFEDEAEATLAISSIVRRDLNRIVAVSPDDAQATLAITSIVRKKLNITYDYNDEANATLAISSIVRK